jgi:hypothetical protein
LPHVAPNRMNPPLKVRSFRLRIEFGRRRQFGDGC